MAGRRKAEGIALLSVYGEQDSDDDLDGDASPSHPAASHAQAVGGRAPGSIVDYAHDEAAPSPEHEEGEILSAGRAVLEDAIEVDNGGLHEKLLTPLQTRSPGKGLTPSRDEGELQISVAQDTIENGGNTPVAEPDALADFLPSPPRTPCSEELQAKFGRYSILKEGGRSFNDDLRNSKGYRNPDFLQRAVKYQNIDQIGSCFNLDIFNPHAYHPSDFYDALAGEQRREMERKEQERKQGQRNNVDFVRATSAAGLLPDLRPKPIIQILTAHKSLSAISTQVGMGEASTAITTSSTSVIQTVTSTSDLSAKPEARSSKKSKWDKASHH